MSRIGAGCGLVVAKEVRMNAQSLSRTGAGTIGWYTFLGGCQVAATDTLSRPEACAMLLVDFQAGLGFGVESAPRQVLLNNAVALARTAVAFGVPVVASTSASRVYSG